MTPPREGTVATRSFFSCLAGLPENAFAHREWRGLAHQARDWRLWVGVRLPRDARGWGLPAVAWFSVAPYFVWAALAAGHRAAPAVFTFPPTPGVPPLDILALCYSLLGFYVCLISVAVMAPAIARERENGTWEALRATASSAHEILLGLAAGRLGPILAAFAAAGLFWVLARPHYAPLLQPYAPFHMSGPEVALLVWEIIAVAGAFGTMALAASALAGHSGRALAAAAAASLVLAGAIGATAVFCRGVPGAAAVLLWCIPVTAAAYTAAWKKVSALR